MRLHVPAFVVIGGGEAGSFYLRQLLRAVAAGLLATERILVVDRDPACPVSTIHDPCVHLETADWSEWLAARLGSCGAEDHLVPYHWAPHLLVAWLAHEALRAGATVRRGGELPSPGVPFERSTRNGDLALSYATWVCPPACIEPALCPHTGGPKDWSLIGRLEAAPGPEERIVLPSLHLVWGVATIPVRAIHAARDRVLAGGRSFVVATSSHCHALATRLEVIGARD